MKLFIKLKVINKAVVTYLVLIFFCYILLFQELQDKLLEAERALDEALRKSNEERSRRRTLHNTLIVRLFKSIH